MTKDKQPSKISDAALENVQGGLLDYEWIAKSKAPMPGDKNGNFYEAGDLNNIVATSGDKPSVKGK